MRRPSRLTNTKSLEIGGAVNTLFAVYSAGEHILRGTLTHGTSRMVKERERVSEKELELFLLEKRRLC